MLFFSALGKWHLCIRVLLSNSKRDLELFASWASFEGTPSDPIATVRLNF